MKQISIESIKSGVLVGKPRKVSVEITVKGEPCFFTTYIRPYSYETAISNMRAFGEKREALAGIIASSISDEKGDAIFTEDDVRGKFSESLVHALWLKIVEINALGKPLNSKMQTKSSAKSQSQRGGHSSKSRRYHTQKSKSCQPTFKKEEVSTLGGASSKK